MGRNRWTERMGPAVAVAPGARVERFEVFFDLVFVFSFFIITRATAMSVTGTNLLHAMLVLAVLWWVWVIHTVVATRVRLGVGFVPALMVVAMAALFSFALALPQAFGDPRYRAAGPVVVALSYVVIRGVHLLLYWHVAREKPGERRLLLKYSPELMISTALLLSAALIPPFIDNTGRAAMVRDGLWLAVVVLQYSSGLVAGAWGWMVTSAEHWTERYDLILIIALGESIISVGVGGNLLGRPVTGRAVVAAVLGVVFTAALWWAHFDVIAPAARIAQHVALDRPRVAMARDAYGYCHLVMIAGIILFAIGAEEIVRQIADRSVPLAEPPPHGSAVSLLFGGVAGYLCGNMLFQARTLRTLSWTRVGTVLVLGAAIPLAQRLPGLATLGLLAVICVGMVAVELVVMADARKALLAVVFEERTTYERHEADFRARWHDVEPDEKAG
ncbi:low temperature requirement protein A [Micromonospora sp. DR5-3]|uniref:low temperature requirement protein A n=1 Tax=unclassified Micromonospora TaxID=2617518 RepID=UPI0011D9DDBF|nr:MULTISPECIES: low temperature requirement protein A [unclassified Micromonospora]MCW3814165.1 low temperature requirement protein A [Micromonospora sp. DR5-3]TYC25048.1 low temperature requirement protein A [Micromonospora sp. MP36]